MKSQLRMDRDMTNEMRENKIEEVLLEVMLIILFLQNMIVSS